MSVASAVKVREYYAKNRDAILSQKMEYYQKHRAEILENKKQYHEVNRESILPKMKVSYVRNKEKRKQEAREYYRENRERCKIKSKEKHQKTREAWLKIIKTMEMDKCVYCGYDRCFDAIDFHHINPLAKADNIAKVMKRVPTKAGVCELSKCVALCATCHRELHFMGDISGWQPQQSQQPRRSAQKH